VAIQGDTIVSGSLDRTVKVWELPIENPQQGALAMDEGSIINDAEITRMLREFDITTADPVIN